MPVITSTDGGHLATFLFLALTLVKMIDSEVKPLPHLSHAIQKLYKYGFIKNFPPKYLQYFYLCHLLLRYYRPSYNLKGKQSKRPIPNTQLESYDLTTQLDYSSSDSDSLQIMQAQSNSSNSTLIHVPPPTPLNIRNNNSAFELEGMRRQIPNTLAEIQEREPSPSLSPNVSTLETDSSTTLDTPDPFSFQQTPTPPNPIQTRAGRISKRPLKFDDYHLY